MQLAERRNPMICQWRCETLETLLFISLAEFPSYNLFLYHAKSGAIFMLISVKSSAFKCKYYITKFLFSYFSRCRFNGPVKLKRSNSTAKKLNLFRITVCQRSLQNLSVLANICIKKFVCVRPKTYSHTYSQLSASSSWWLLVAKSIVRHLLWYKKGCSFKFQFDSNQIKKFQLNWPKPNAACKT